MIDLDNLPDNGRMHIHLGEPWKVAYWTRVLDVSEDELRTLLQEVGDDTCAVRTRLAERREATQRGAASH